MTALQIKQSKVQFITHFTPEYTYLDSARIALEGGCRWIQLRMKEADETEMLPIALQIQALCKSYHATFIIDDHVELVKRIEADGVHLGKTDMPVAEARRLLGDSYIIGGTANTFEDIVNLQTSGADYVGCGPFRYTTTKQKLSPIIGIEGYRQLFKKTQSNGISIPIVAIGGITSEDIPDILQTGASGIALSGSILRAQDPVLEMKTIIQLIK